VTVNNSVQKIINYNDCTPSASRNVVKEELFHCKKEARAADGKSIPSILNAGLRRLKDRGTNLVEKLSNLNNVKGTLYNARNKWQQIKKSSFRKPSEVEILFLILVIDFILKCSRCI
jgi:hypothetical protein